MGNHPPQSFSFGVIISLKMRFCTHFRLAYGYSIIGWANGIKRQNELKNVHTIAYLDEMRVADATG